MAVHLSSSRGRDVPAIVNVNEPTSITGTRHDSSSRSRNDSSVRSRHSSRRSRSSSRDRSIPDRGGMIGIPAKEVNANISSGVIYDGTSQNDKAADAAMEESMLQTLA